MANPKLNKELINQLALIVANKANSDSDIESLCEETYKYYLKAYEYFKNQKLSTHMEVFK